MLRRSSLAIAAILSPVLSATAKENKPLEWLLPAETAFYVAADARMLLDGANSLGLANLLREPEMRAFLEPLYQQMPELSPDDPIGSLAKLAPIADYVGGRVALGFSGVTLESDVLGLDEPLQIRLSPDSPLSARSILALIPPPDGADQDVPFDRISFDFLAQVEAGPKLHDHVSEFLAHPPENFEVGSTTLNGHAVKVLTFDIQIDHSAVETTIFAELTGNRWLLGGDPKTFAAALGGGPPASLGDEAGFQGVRSRVCDGGGIAFAYLDVAKANRVLKHFLAPIAQEFASLLGLDSIRGIGFGMSAVEGSIRESFTLAFDGKRSGLLSLLEAFDGGISGLGDAPAGTAGYIGLRFDPKVAYDRACKLVDELYPRGAPQVHAMLDQVEVGGLKLVDDIIPAFGGEISIAVTPKNSIIPDVVLTVELRDPGKFGKVLESLQSLASREAGIAIQPFPLADGGEGFSVKVPDAHVQPCFALRGNKLYGAITGPLLKQYLSKHVGSAQRQTLAGSSPVMARILKGLNGNHPERLMFLAYGDLFTAAPIGYELLTPALPGLLDEAGLPLDAAMLPATETIQQHLTGVAFGISSDAHGISFDVFSPTGLATVGAAAGFIAHRQQAAALRAFEMQNPREMEEDEGDDEDVDDDV